MKRSLAFKFFWLGFLLVGSAINCLSQDSRTLITTDKLSGKVKSITEQRTYFVVRGNKVSPFTVIIATDYYSEEGNLIQSSVFGNVEERRTYIWTGDTFTTSVQYFDANGIPALELSKQFTPLANDIPESGLCSEYSVRKEKDVSANIDRIFEICKDKSIRRSTVYEMSRNNKFLRKFVEDARGRTIEVKNNFGVNFVLLGFRFTVNDLIQPQYWQEVTYSNEQRDDKKNIIRRTCTSTHSRYPGQVRFEYLEEYKILYYD